MSHFNLKSLSFYGVAIGSVVILFNVVSAYGESKLKAPPAIDGRYRISAENLPECLKSQALILNIQQSGIYLSGSLLSAGNRAHSETTAEENPSLTGLWQNEQLNLSGSVPHVTTCNNPAVTIQGRLEEKNIAGKMHLSSIPGKVEFTAQPEPVQQQKKEH